MEKQLTKEAHRMNISFDGHKGYTLCSMTIDGLYQQALKNGVPSAVTGIYVETDVGIQFK